MAELASVGLAVTSASAQNATQERQQIKRQQQVIIEQQRRIEQNQARLEAQQRQLAVPAAAAAPPQTINRGLFGNIGNCPVGWTFSLFSGCLPAVVVIH